MMEIWEQLLDSFGTLTLNKTRTGLAILGVVIGIGSVIALVSLGQATQQSIQNQIQSLGANLLTISPGSARQSGGVREAAGSRTSLTLDDAKAIAASSDLAVNIGSVSPEYSGRTQITTAGNNTNTQVVGATPTYPGIHKVTIASGNFITQMD